MSALVVSDLGEDWFTNSHTWSIILERAFAMLSPERRDEYEWHADTVGVNFELMPPEKRPEIAQWLLAVIEELLGPAGTEYGWDKPRDQQHLGDLAAMLRRMAEGNGE